MIPKDFHFIYGLKSEPQEFHLVHYLCLRSCREVNEPDRIRLYCRHEPFGPYWEKVRPWVTVIGVSPPGEMHGRELVYAHQSDFLRLEILNARGGVYADMDTLFINRLPRELYSHPFVMGVEGDHGLCNAFLMGERNSFFGLKWRAVMEEVFDFSWNVHSVITPGKLARAYPGTVHVEPRESFFKHTWDGDGLRNLFSSVDLHLERSYSLHLWANLSWEPHLGGLTEETLREGGNTYAVLARRFL
ncbi:MAG: hypothetical protein GX443_10680 [Deltaproteobacteria bacterium]|nr:hypothetical protein [Deltaproteobacteria bacterium]